MSGTMGSATDTSSSPTKMPATKDNATWGPAGLEYGGTYQYDLTCGSCHNYSNTIKAHRRCTACHTDSTGSVLKPTLRNVVVNNPNFTASLTTCTDCHNGTIAQARIQLQLHQFTAPMLWILPVWRKVAGRPLGSRARKDAIIKIWSPSTARSKLDMCGTQLKTRLSVLRRDEKTAR